MSCCKMPIVLLCLGSAWSLQFKGRCNQAATCDVMMDKLKYFYGFVNFSVGNVIFLYNIHFHNQHLDRQNDMLNLDIWPLA